MTQEDLAPLLGITAGQLSRIENEIQKPSVPDQVNALIAALPLSADQLLRSMGVRLSPAGTRRLPTRLVEILLEMPPESLAGLLTVLEGARTTEERARQ